MGLFTQSKAQDTLFLKNTEKLTVKLVEINPDNVKYKLFSNQAGETFTSLKNEINQIVFANGKKEIYDTLRIGKKDTLSNTNVIATKKAADTLIFNNGKIIAGKILAINTADIKYKIENNPDGPTYSVLKTEIKEIIFATGLHQSFKNENNTDNNYSHSNTASNSTESLFLKGQTDAKQYYRNGGGSVAVGILTVLSPIIGLIPAVICSAFQPKERKLGYQNNELWKKPEYRLAYTMQAYKIKKRKIWITFGACTAVSVILTAILKQ